MISELNLTKLQFENLPYDTLESNLTDILNIKFKIHIITKLA